MPDVPHKIAENSWVILTSRISIPLLAFIGLFAWNDLRAQGADVQQILRRIDVYEFRLSIVERDLAALQVATRVRTP